MRRLRTVLHRLPGRTRTLLAAYTAMSAVNVTAELTGHRTLAVATKATLMPLLLAALATGTRARPRVVGWSAAALIASWAGDLALAVRGDAWFRAGLAAFLVAHVCYLVAFWPWARDSLRRRPLIVVPFLAWWVVLLVVLGPHVGELLIPVALYGLVLVAMAACATGLGPLAATGGVLFVLSDSLIAATSLTDRFGFTGSNAVVMATYTLGQALIVLGVLDAARQGQDAATVDVGARS